MEEKEQKNKEKYFLNIEWENQILAKYSQLQAHCRSDDCRPKAKHLLMRTRVAEAIDYRLNTPSMRAEVANANKSKMVLVSESQIKEILAKLEQGLKETSEQNDTWTS